MHAPLRVLAVLAFLAGIAFGPAPAGATTIALVIAIDTSGSIDATEFALQRQAYVDFFNNNAAGFAGKDVAVTVLYWGGAGVQQQVVPWTTLNSASDAQSFASAMLATTRPSLGGPLAAQTGVGQALLAATGLFSQPGIDFSGASKVIDISGDGSENLDQTAGFDITLDFAFGTFTTSVTWDDAFSARASALAAGILINALPIIPIGRAQPVEVFDSDPAGAAIFGSSPPASFPGTQAEWDAALIATFGSLNTTTLEFFYSRVIGSPDSRIPLMIVANGFTAQELGDRIAQKLSLELNVPEPATLLMLACALGVFAIVRRNHRAR